MDSMQKLKLAAAGFSDVDAVFKGALQACGIVRVLPHAAAGAAHGLQEMPAIAALL